jgi:pectin methylesterase-like acyl-CoA thioesterase
VNVSKILDRINENKIQTVSYIFSKIQMVSGSRVTKFKKCNIAVELVIYALFC